MPQEYLEYVGEFSLSLLAVSAAYFVDPSSTHTLGALLLVPVLFGYTAYISRNGFQRSSLLSGVALFFTVLNPIVAAVAIVIVTGNVLISFFASGESFRDFYGATTLPLLFTGLVLGLATYGAATTYDDIGDTIRNEGSKFLGKQAETAVEKSNIIEAQKNAQVSMMESTSRTTVTATQEYVLNDTREQLGQQDLIAINNAFQEAQTDIPARIKQRADSRTENASLDVSARTQDLASSTLKGKAFLLLIPLITFGLYSLQPLLGLLTAFWASVFRWLAPKG